MKKLETLLAELVNLASPASVKINKTRASFLKDGTTYEVVVTTRGWDECFCGAGIGEAVRNAHESLTNAPEGDLDPVVPSWHRLSRMQREIVEQTLRRHMARHMAQAAEGNVLHTGKVSGEYAIADAFRAAIDELLVEEVDEQLTALPVEPLKEREEESPVVRKRRAIERTDERTPEQREALTKAVTDLRVRNKWFVDIVPSPVPG